MSTPVDQVNEMIVGHWRSQALYAGAGWACSIIWARVRRNTRNDWPLNSTWTPASSTGCCARLASVGLLHEDGTRRFTITEAGEVLRSDHPQSLRDRALLNGGPEHYVIWRHLTDLIRDGRQNAFVREFGAPAFEYARTNDSYRGAFNRGMTSYSVPAADAYTR